MGWMPFLPPNQQCQSTEGLKLFKVSKKAQGPPWQMTGFQNNARQLK